jgi:hypothetical protein
MKNHTSLIVFCAISLCFSSLSSCKKDNTTTLPKEQLIVGNWEINRIQLRVYYGGVFAKDTILAQSPRPKNYVNFGSGGSFNYKWNLDTEDVGTYQFKGVDSVITNAKPDEHRYKLLTLTDKLLTLKNTCNNDPNFPGATVECYHTLIK